MSMIEAEAPEWADMSEKDYWQAHGWALSTAREAAIEQIQKLARALEEQQPSTVFDGAGQRRMIIEAGMLLVALRELSFRESDRTL